MQQVNVRPITQGFVWIWARLGVRPSRELVVGTIMRARVSILVCDMNFDCLACTAKCTAAESAKSRVRLLHRAKGCGAFVCIVPKHILGCLWVALLGSPLFFLKTQANACGIVPFIAKGANAVSKLSDDMRAGAQATPPSNVVWGVQSGDKAEYGALGAALKAVGIAFFDPTMLDESERIDTICFATGVDLETATIDRELLTDAERAVCEPTTHRPLYNAIIAVNAVYGRAAAIIMTRRLGY
jgi:hypothetical protein